MIFVNQYIIQECSKRGEGLPKKETFSTISLQLELTTCFTDALIQEDSVVPAPTVVPWESKRKPCNVLKYEVIFSSNALASGFSPVQSIPTTKQIQDIFHYINSSQL